MARRRTLELPAGAVLFDRSPQEWRELGAPVWLGDSRAAAGLYAEWALPGFGRGMDPDDPTPRRYYVEMMWLPRCVRPQWLSHAGALSSAEAELLASDRWGRPGRCRAPMLAPGADVPAWLVCCRRGDRRGTA
ncbi:MAG: hypothetical protein WBF75_15920 [Pseudonocardiaceae bacterium]